MKNKTISFLLKIVGVGIAIVGARMLALHPIVGSVGAMFSWSTMVAPVVGQQCGLAWVVGFLCAKKIYVLPSLLGLLHRTPLFFSAYFFKKTHTLFLLVVCCSCIVLFVAHPVGIDAWPYALYWLIPIALLFVKGDWLWVRALQASFVAHAIGSIVWLYTHPITASVWLGLIPIVWYERLLMACGMVLLSQLCDFFKKVVVQLLKKCSNSSFVFDRVGA